MYKKTITYTDYNGVERTDDYYFNLNKAEIVELNNSEIGGLESFLTRIINEENNVEIVKMFKQFVLMSYGEKSSDGRRFVKSPELSEAFSQTEAYSELFMELASNAEFAAEFVNGVCASINTDPNRVSLARSVSSITA